MCVFSGLFGISTILFSLNDNSTIPHQNPFYDLNIDYSEFSEQTIAEIREGFEMGENSYKEYAKVRK